MCDSAPGYLLQDVANALVAAAQNGHAVPVAILLRHGADPDAANADGERVMCGRLVSITHVLPAVPGRFPLQAADDAGDDEVMQLLFRAGANPQRLYSQVGGFARED